MKLANVITCLFALHCCISSLVASEWKSPDGAISVEQPDVSKFKEVQPGSPVLVAWIGKDKPIQLGIIQMSIPKGITRLDQKSVEEGFAEEIKGKITNSSVGQISGRTVFIMTAQGKISDKDVFATQHILSDSIDGKIFKIMVTSIGKDELASDDARIFLDSFKVLREIKASEESKSSIGSEKDKSNMSGASLTHELSKKIGGGCFFLLIVCIVVLWLKRKQTAVKKSPENKS
jgi:hypothetical protein